jgi:hypothetical protein
LDAEAPWESLNYDDGVARGMWSILGADALYLDIPHVLKSRLAELSGEGDAGERFRGFLGSSEVMFLLNGETEECSFFITVPDELGPEDIQLMADAILDIARSSELPFVAAGGAEQRFKVIINNQREPELVGLNKTPGMSSAEVFKPIFRALDSPGRMNSRFDL